MPHAQSTKSPDVRKCRALYERIDDVINNGHDVAIVDASSSKEHPEALDYISEPDLVAMRDALEWVYVFLMNRRDYHKRRNTKTKVEMQLLEDALRRKGIDVESIKKNAASVADDEVIDNDDEP